MAAPGTTGRAAGPSCALPELRPPGTSASPAPAPGPRPPSLGAPAAPRPAPRDHPAPAPHRADSRRRAPEHRARPDSPAAQGLPKETPGRLLGSFRNRELRDSHLPTPDPLLMMPKCTARLGNFPSPRPSPFGTSRSGQTQTVNRVQRSALQGRMTARGTSPRPPALLRGSLPGQAAGLPVGVHPPPRACRQGSSSHSVHF